MLMCVCLYVRVHACTFRAICGQHKHIQGEEEKQGAEQEGQLQRDIESQLTQLHDSLFEAVDICARRSREGTGGDGGEASRLGAAEGGSGGGAGGAVELCERVLALESDLLDSKRRSPPPAPSLPA